MKVLKAILGCFLSIGMMIGCSTTSSNNPAGPASLADITNADAKTTQADSVMENVLSSDPSLNNPDVTAAKNLYVGAIAINPANTQAQFGAAVTTLLISTQNQDFKTFVDSLEVSTPSGTGLFKSAVIPIKLNGNAVVSSEKIVLNMANASTTQIPKISSLQKIVNDSVMPEIDYALARLAVIESDPNFVFKITPKMQGNASGKDTFNLDNGEIFVIDAGLRIIQASLFALISYNVDVDMNGSYSWLSSSGNSFASESTSVADVKQLLTSSTFLALNPWGEVSMQGVSANLRTSLTKLTDAVNEINGETHDQSHDIIKISDLDSADSQLANGSSGSSSINAVIDTISKVLNGPYTFTNNSVSITINFTKIFDTPIQDLKTKFPKYTWLAPSQWRSVDTSIYSNYSYSGNTFTYDTSYDTSVGTPIQYLDANNQPIPIDSLTFDKMVFPDYTFGGLFPDLTTKAAWDNLINSINNQSNQSSGPLFSSGNLYGIGFPLAKIFR